MTPRQLFLELEEQERKNLPLLRFVFLTFQENGFADAVIEEEDDAENFYHISIHALQQLWEHLLSRTVERLVGMERFSDEEVRDEINKAIALLREFLNKRFELELPEQKLEVPGFH